MCNGLSDQGVFALHNVPAVIMAMLQAHPTDPDIARVAHTFLNGNVYLTGAYLADIDLVSGEPGSVCGNQFPQVRSTRGHCMCLCL